MASERTRMTKRLDDLPAILLLAALVSVMLAFVLPMPLSRLDVPYSFVGDTVDKLTQIKTVAENGWLFHNDRLGYPFGYDRLDFPRFDSLNYAIIGPIAALTGESGLAMNLYFIATFYLIALAAFYCLRRLELDIGPAFICALAFAFLPYHLFRGVPHLTNGAYFLIPPALLVLIRLAQNYIGFQTPDTRRRWVLAIIVAALLPLQTPYNGVFFALLCVAAGLIWLAQGWHWRKIIIILSLLAATGGAFVIEQIPRWVHQAENGATDVGSRNPLEAQLYSMHLNQVLLPTLNHRLGILRRQTENFNTVMRVPPTEIRHQYIGLLGIVGLIALLWALFRGLSEHVSNKDTNKLEESVRIAALLGICVILISISTGLGTLIAYFLTSSIRAYNRILPFLAFLALIGGGWVLHLAMRRIRKMETRIGITIIAGLALLLDITPRAMSSQERSRTIADYDLAHDYFKQMEKSVGKDTAIFQMPVVWYPEHPHMNKAITYDELKPFLLTNTLRFLTGAARGRPGYSWGRFIERQPASDIVKQAHALGFGAILLDGFAYSPENFSKLTGALVQILPEPPIISTNKRWWTFPLINCCGTLSIQPLPGIKSDVFTYNVNDGPIRFTPNGRGRLYLLYGWHPIENWGVWMGKEASLRINLTPVPTGPLRLSLDTRMMLGPRLPQRTLRIACNNAPCGEFLYTPEKSSQRLQITLPSKLMNQDGQLNLRFTVTPEATPVTAGVNEDFRSLGLGLTELIITPKN